MKYNSQTNKIPFPFSLAIMDQGILNELPLLPHKNKIVKVIKHMFTNKHNTLKNNVIKIHTFP